MLPAPLQMLQVRISLHCEVLARMLLMTKLNARSSCTTSSMADGLTINQVDGSRHHLNALSHLETPLDGRLSCGLHGSRQLGRHVGQFDDLEWFGIAPDIGNHGNRDLVSRGGSGLQLVRSHGHGVESPTMAAAWKSARRWLSQKTRVASESW